MNPNLQIILIVSILFGLATGIYDLALPYYLHEQNISFQNMGIIFAIAALGIFFVRIYIGHLSDISGRKIYYALALCGNAFANLITPLTANVAIQSFLKTVRETSVMIKESLQSVLVYEHDKKRFTDWIGKTRGMEYFTEGLGTILVAGFLLFTGYRGSLVIAGGLLVIAFLIFVLRFHEPEKVEFMESFIPPHPRMYDFFNLPRELKIIAVAGFICGIGTSASHCFVMPLFFAKKFDASPQIVAVILALHRVVLALPMIFVSKFLTKNLKWIYIWFLAIQSISISATALIPAPYLWTAVGVWFIHDLVGGGIWAPAYYALIQQNSRTETRALDTSKVMAINQLGWVVGPLLAGWLFSISYSYPFFFGGLISLSSVFILLKLK
ncbi:MAG: MFS transporter [bacterium]|nr:MFS transporter [bacterium]